MIEAQKQIGSVLLEDSEELDFVNYILENVAAEKKGKRQHIIILNLNTEEGRLEIDNKLIGENTAQKYTWIGTADGAASPQWYFTSSKPDYLASQTVPNMLKKLPPESRLYKLLNNALNHFYYDQGEQKGMANRYRYVLDLGKLGVADFNIEDIIEKSQGKVKKVVKEVAKGLTNYVKESKGINVSQMELWTLQIDGVDIVNEEEYIKLVIEEKIDSLFTGQQGICSLCKEKKEVTDNTTRFEFKYYMTDKRGYSSELTGNFYKNMALCKDCYQEVLAGESYIKKNLSFNVGGFRVYLVPYFIYKPEGRLIKKQLPGFNLIKDSLFNINEVLTIEEPVQRYTELIDSGNTYIFNMLFYEKNQAEFKILRLIKDIPPSRFQHLVEESSKVRKLFTKHLGDSGLWGIDFNRIYYMLPIRTSGGSPVEHRELLNIYSSILSKQPIKKEFLITQFIKMARIHYYQKHETYNINKANNPEQAMAYSILQNMALLQYLEGLDLVKGGNGMDVDSLIVDEGIKEYISDLNFDEQEAALLMLGYLIGEVAGRQTAILNKINFQGMSKTKVERLISEVFEKLKQYDVLKYNRDVFSDMKRLFDRNLDNWDLSAQDNVFYLLSGYAYQVRRVTLKNKEKNEEEGEIANEE